MLPLIMIFGTAEIQDGEELEWQQCIAKYFLSRTF